MAEDDDRSEDLVRRIADGQPIDWSSLGDDAVNLHKLQALETLCRGFAGLHPARREEAQASSHAALFEWGHLQVMQRIGAGSSGEVYRAHDSVLDRAVALKLLKPSHLAPHAARAFIQEARMLARVRNRHVLAVHGADVHDGRVGMWSDLLDGDDLSEPGLAARMRDGDALLRIGAALSDALQAVHEAGLIHGDVKPANVMLDRGEHLVLMDFGAGREHSEQTNRENWVQGTPYLMAPELFTGGAPHAGVDVYALGALLYKLASGHYPVEARNVVELKHKLLHARPAALHTLRGDLHRDVCKLIHQMLSANPAQRPSASELVRRFAWIRGAPQRRNKRRLRNGIIASLLLGTLISSAGFYRASQAQRSAENAQQQAESLNTFLLDMLNSVSLLGKAREVRVADMLDLAAQNVPQQLFDRPSAQRAVHTALASAYMTLQLPDDAIAQFQLSLEALPVDTPAMRDEKMRIQVYMAKALQMTGEDARAVDLLNEILAQAVKDDPVHRRLTWLAHIRLAEIDRSAGRPQPTEARLQKLFADPLLATEAPDLLIDARRMQAENLLLQSRFTEAERLSRVTLNMLQRSEDSGFMDRLDVQSAIAKALVRQGKLGEAEALYRQLLQESHKLLGRYNSTYLYSLINLAGVLQDTGQLNEAMAHLQQAMELAQNTQGIEIMTTVGIGTNLANLKVSLGDLAGGETWMRRTLETSSQGLGEDHLQTLLLEYNLAELLNNSARHAQARQSAELTLQKTIRALGSEHLLVWLTLDNLAIALAGEGRMDAAIERHLQAVAGLERTQGEDNRYTLLALQHFTETLQTAGQKTDLKEQLESLWQRQARSLGNEHPDTLATRQRLDALTPPPSNAQ